jgi:predicted transposase YdaD
MSKPFDATSKFLVETRPEDWVAFLHLPPGPVEIKETDMSTVSAAADRVVYVDAEEPYILHIEFQADKDNEMIERMLEYHVHIARRQKIPVETVLIVLRSFEGHRRFTGHYRRHGARGRTNLSFDYTVERIWQKDPEEFLNGGLATLPFAVVAKVRKNAVASMFEKVEARLLAEATANEAITLRKSTLTLLGLKYNQAFVEKLMETSILEKSPVYQGIVAIGEQIGEQKGEIKASLDIAITLGKMRFGEPSKEILDELQKIESVDLLKRLITSVYNVKSWDELLSKAI